jgi:hypothetical protein
MRLRVSIPLPGPFSLSTSIGGCSAAKGIGGIFALAVLIPWWSLKLFVYLGWWSLVATCYVFYGLYLGFKWAGVWTYRGGRELTKLAVALYVDRQAGRGAR